MRFKGFPVLGWVGVSISVVGFIISPFTEPVFDGAQVMMLTGWALAYGVAAADEENNKSLSKTGEENEQVQVNRKVVKVNRRKSRVECLFDAESV